MPSQPPATEPPSLSPRKPGFRRPVLVVDDEPEMLFSLRNLLRREFDLHTASSGDEGMRILGEQDIHVVMTDQRMPHMTGVELLSRMKTEYPGAMRLIFTGYADIKAVIAAINQGNVFRYVTKPWDPDELVHALREAGERYDQIVGRNQLLSDLRDYERRGIAYAEHLAGGSLGALTDDGAKQAKTLLEQGRTLAARLDHALAAMVREPMC